MNKVTLAFKTLKIFFLHVGRYKFGIFVVIATVIFGSLFDIIVPLYLKDFFDTLANAQDRSVALEELLRIVLLIGVMQFFHWLAFRVATFMASHYSTKIVADLSNTCYQYMMKHSFTFFNNNFVGSLVKRVQWFIRAYMVVFDRLVWNLLPLVVIVSLTIIVMATISPWLALVILIWLILFVLANAFFTKYKLKYDIQRSEAETVRSGFLADTITNHVSVRLFNGYHSAISRFGELVDDVRRLHRFTWNLSNTIDALQGGSMFLLNVGVLYLAAILWEQGIVTVGDFVLIQSYLFFIFIRIWDLGRIVRDIFENLADAVEMTEILEESHEIQDIDNAKELKVSTGAITFRSVAFTYQDGAQVFDGFNFVIKPRERIALIGPSGAGKTTTIRLIMRMHNVDDGVVQIDGQDISQVTQESLWKNISMVPQDPVLFHRPLIENIRYGKPDATDEEVIAAAKAAHAHEFITQLPGGYDTLVGERGLKLSGGERQRIAIARAILRNAPILILDEATSSLDSESEHYIQDALEKLMKDKTVIVIAHRLSTIKKMNRIVVIDDGQVVEEGQHKDLKHLSDGVYRKLWELQAGGFN